MEKIQAIISFISNSTIGWAMLAFALPLIAFVVSMFLNSKKLVSFITLLIMALSFSAACFLIFETAMGRSFEINLNWLEIGSFKLNISVVIDNITAVMLSMVSLITLLVLLYSTEYMKGEKRYNYFFAYISLFAFAMFGLVLSNNLLWTYIFWELVGFCSYLLIGFYTQKNAAIFANKKAFIINRIGDLGFLIGLMILLSVFRNLDLTLIKTLILERGTFISASDKILLHYAGYAFFIAVIAKSAQFPLHVWLPDAMEGPTPVSALIHAATMVISGVYLLIRIFFLLDVEVLNLIVLLGSFTAFFGAFIAGRQFDIKKILAYSTISQLGLMVMAIGISAPMAAFYHLITHAFFKAALFLAAGSIIHYVQHHFETNKLNLDAQDIRNMGGLWNKIPFTFYTYTLAAAALVGFPFVSGFFSKEAILNETWNWALLKNNTFLIVPFFAFGSVLMTAFYVFRHYSLVFFAPSKMKFEQGKEPSAFIVPFIVLSIACIYVYPLYHVKQAVVLLPYITVSLISIGFLAAYVICYRNIIKPFNENSLMYKLSYNAFYVDNIYKLIFLKPINYVLNKLQPVDLKFDDDMIRGLGNSIILFSHFVAWFDLNIIDRAVNFTATIGLQLSYLSAWIDKNIIDTIVNAVAKLSRSIGDLIRAFQTGKLQSYVALSAFLLVIFIWFITRGV